MGQEMFMQMSSAQCWRFHFKWKIIKNTWNTIFFFFFVLFFKIWGGESKWRKLGERGKQLINNFQPFYGMNLKKKKSQFFLKCGYVIIECILLPCNKKKKIKKEQIKHICQVGEKREQLPAANFQLIFFVLIIIVIN